MRRAGRGRIVNVSSMGGRHDASRAAAYYHATKYAVEALSDALRVEVEPFGVDVVVDRAGRHRSGFEETISASDALADRPRLPLRRDAGEGVDGETPRRTGTG